MRWTGRRCARRRTAPSVSAAGRPSEEEEPAAAGNKHSLALKSDGTVWAWGVNGSGQLGDGTTTQRTTPVQVSGLSGVTALAAGGSHSLALSTDGTKWAWGLRGNGRLGDGNASLNSCSPVRVASLLGTPMP